MHKELPVCFVVASVCLCYMFSCLAISSQRRRKDFLIGGAQSETTHRVVSNLYDNL